MNKIFAVHLIFDIHSSPSDVADRFSSRLTPLKLNDNYEKSLHPLGTVVGFVSDGRFEIKELMNGLGGATAIGTLTPAKNGTRMEATIHPGLFMKFTFVALSIIYLFFCIVLSNMVFHGEVTRGKVFGFLGYTLMLTAAWALLRLETKGLKTFFEDMASI